MTAGGLCGEKSCFTNSKVEGCDRQKEWGRCVCACVFGGDCVNVRVCVCLGGQYVSLGLSQSLRDSLLLNLFVFC